MATDTLMAPLPQVALGPGMQIRLEAIDPTTGAAVAGVTVKAIAVYGPDTATAAGGPSSAAAAPVVVGPFLLVPGPEG